MFSGSDNRAVNAALTLRLMLFTNLQLAQLMLGWSSRPHSSQRTLIGPPIADHLKTQLPYKVYSLWLEVIISDQQKYQMRVQMA